jgi:spore maturation protein CgeB
MKPTLAVFGSSLVSAYWNGAATYYRGIFRALAQCGFSITFYEPDAFDRQAHRDIPDPEWARVVVYPGNPRDESGVWRAIDEASTADILVKTSGVGVFDRLLDEAILESKAPHTQTIFWDVDAPATLDRIAADPGDPFRPLIPRYDLVLTYGGGTPVVEAYTAAGARQCVPIYNALDPDTHHPAPPDDRFAADLGFLGNRLPDREARVEQFLFAAAERASASTFVLGGNGWGDKRMPSNLRYVGHVYSRDHNAFNSTPRAVLNVSRESMARYGFSPATRVFEAAGAGACIITDDWRGIELFLEPDVEVLLAHDGEEVADQLQRLDGGRAARIGEAARRRVMTEHTYAQRAADLDALLGAGVEAR